MVDDNRALIRRLYDELFTQWRLELIDELFSPAYLGHELPPGTPPGPAGVHELYAGLRAAYPGMSLRAEDIIAEGDKVVVRWTAQSVPAKGTAIYRLRDGQIVERWVDVTFREP